MSYSCHRGKRGEKKALFARIDQKIYFNTPCQGLSNRFLSVVQPWRDVRLWLMWPRSYARRFVSPCILSLVDPRAVAGSKCSTAGSFIQTIRQVPGGGAGWSKVCLQWVRGFVVWEVKPSARLSRSNIPGRGELCAQQAINSSVFLYHSALQDSAKASSRQWLMGWCPTALDWIRATHSRSLCLLFAGSLPTKLTSLVVVFSFASHPLFQYFPHDFISFVR